MLVSPLKPRLKSLPEHLALSGNGPVAKFWSDLRAWRADECQTRPPASRRRKRLVPAQPGTLGDFLAGSRQGCGWRV